MIIDPKDKQFRSLLGGKGKALAELGDAGFRVPSWFAVTDDAPANSDELTRRAEHLGGKNFAIRSSAAAEDGVEHSFAGQFDTFLYVPIDRIAECVEKVHHSHSSERLDSYQKSHDLQQSAAPTAIVQVMLTPEVSGVAFSADPVSGDLETVVISALWGTGSALVSGEADADSWRVKGNTIASRNIAQKTICHVADPDDPEGVSFADVPKFRQSIPSLTDAQLREVAQLGRRCEKHFGCPQDIEWAIADGTLYLLQSRPFTTLSNKFDRADEQLTVWDNSNIAESYSGVTSTMTFSFAERAYEHVYREFCRILSVPDSRIRKHDHVFSNMLGHIRGHVYYNLNSWYHVLAMLPGFSINRSFMEQMMGVKQAMPDEVMNDILRQTQTGKMRDACSLLKMVLGLIRNHIKLPKMRKQFYRRLNQALTDEPLEKMTRSELIQHYQSLENQLLTRWDAPLVNDFFAMIHVGLLRGLCEKWLGDATLQNQILLDCGEVISAEPPRRIRQMANTARQHPSLVKTLADIKLPAEEKLRELEKFPDVLSEYERYLSDFGDRCMEELKLESPTVGDDPQSLLTSIGAMAKREESTVATYRTSDTIPGAQLGFVRRKVFSWVVRQARARVRDRENLRFERTRLFGRVRQIILQLGKRMHDEAAIEDPRDVFFLTLPEVVAADDLDDLKERVQSRKTEQDKWNAPPPDRFETRGAITADTPLVSSNAEAEPSADGLCGTGACPGIVRGRVRVVHDPRGAVLREGEILVAQQTDPGWVVLFPAAAGLLVERGSLLSHSAIVARELNLPCVVSIRDVTKRLTTGDQVEMNGSTGEIRILES